MKKLTVLSALILLFLINGCSEKIVYIKTPCPKLHNWIVKPLDLNVTYKVYDEKS